MRVGGIAPPLFAAAAKQQGAAPLDQFQRMSQYRLSNQRLMDIRRIVLRTERVFDASSIRSRAAGTSVTLTGTALGLDEIGASSSISSTAEVNAASTSIADRTPDWMEASDAQIILDGTWTGTIDDTLTFIPNRDRDLPTNKGVKIGVYNGAGQRIDNVQVGDGYTPGDPITLSNGLTMSVSAGFLEGDDTATINLSATVGSALVRTNPFNGTGDQDAVFEDGHTITTGSFTLNGTSIAVNDTDTLDDVLDRINAAGLGVTASYDEVTEQVTIVDDDIGPDAITLADDTSGLLAALKLDGATTSLGWRPDQERALSTVAAFSGVTNGTITVNGTDVDIDVGSDSLEDVIAALDGIDGVSAAFTNGRVLISGSVGTSLEVADSSGLLDVLDIATGSHQAVQRVRGLSRQRAIEVSGLIHELAQAVHAMLADQLAGPSAASGITRLRASLATEFKSVFEADGDKVTGLGGIRFEFSDDVTRGVRASSRTERTLMELLDEGDTETLEALLGNDEGPGLLERLNDYTRLNLAGIRDTLALGNRVDRLA